MNRTLRPAVLALGALLLAPAAVRAQSNQGGGEQLNQTTSANTIANGGSTGAAMPINRVVVPVTPASVPGPATSEKDSPAKTLPAAKPAKRKKFSDRALAKKVHGKIVHELGLPQGSQGVQASAAAGKITLTGAVLTEDDKYKIAAAAADLVGEENVVNLIDVKPAAPPPQRP